MFAISLPSRHTSNSAPQQTKNKKSPLKPTISEGFWSEQCGSNARSPGPKAGALPTALHPVIEFFIRLVVFSQSKRATNCANPGFLVIQFCTRCGQTCGQAVFLTTLACGGNACIAGVSMDCEDSVFRLEGGATRSQRLKLLILLQKVAFLVVNRH